MSEQERQHRVEDAIFAYFSQRGLVHNLAWSVKYAFDRSTSSPVLAAASQQGYSLMAISAGATIAQRSSRKIDDWDDFEMICLEVLIDVLVAERAYPHCRGLLAKVRDEAAKRYLLELIAHGLGVQAGFSPEVLDRHVTTLANNAWSSAGKATLALAS